jgi:pre-mRNA-splicing factor CWC22
MMQQQITDKSSEAYQRMNWEALKKSIHGLINKVTSSNVSMIVREILQENIVRGRGLLARSVLQAQAFSPTFTNVYAALVAIINTKFPNIGELIIHRLLLNFRKGYRRNNKLLCLSSVQFIAHLVNQNVLHEVAALEMLALLLEEATDDSVEVAVGFLKECGQKLTELAPRALQGVFDSLRLILHDGKINIRVQYMIEVLSAVRKAKFKDYPSVVEELDLVEEEDQFTHTVSLDDELNPVEVLNVFQFDPDYVANEEKYKALKGEILGSSSSEEEGSGDESSEEDEEEEQQKMEIEDRTKMGLMALRRTIYLTIMSSLDFEECAHKLLKMKFIEGQEYEVCSMIIECCSQERSFKKFYGLLGQRFCMLNRVYVEQYDKLFQEHYATVHRLDTVKIRNVGKFFAHLFYSDALPWTSIACIHLNEEETNSSSRIFIKILFQELSEYMSLEKLNQRLNDP